MKSKYLALILLAPCLASAASSKKLDWNYVEKIPPGTQIYVETQFGTECALKKVTEEQLFCTMEYPGAPSYPHEYAEKTFERKDIRKVCVGDMATCTAFDYSAGVPALVAAVGGGGGWRSGSEPNSFAGVRLGFGVINMDLQYDRLNAQNGFSIEGSSMVPLLRAPRYNPKNDKLFLRAYAEPGLGYRAGSGPFGQYASGKVLVLFGDGWVNDKVSPYVEYQRRFPFNSPLDGDNRIAFGFMWALCEHCGLD
jgi:hypothetical protein